MVSQDITRATENQDAFLELPHKLDESGRAAPLLDAYETDNIIELTAESPGVLESDIEVDLEGDVLTISVEKRGGKSDAKQVHFSERCYGRFERSIKLPFAPDPDSVEASVENGVLVLRFPRVQSQRTHRIRIGGTQAKTKDERGAIGSKWDNKAPEEEPLSLTQVVRPSASAPDLSAVPRPKSTPSKA